MRQGRKVIGIDQSDIALRWQDKDLSSPALSCCALINILTAWHGLTNKTVSPNIISDEEIFQISADSVTLKFPEFLEIQLLMFFKDSHI